MKAPKLLNGPIGDLLLQALGCKGREDSMLILAHPQQFGNPGVLRIYHAKLAVVWNEPLTHSNCQDVTWNLQTDIRLAEETPGTVGQLLFAPNTKGMHQNSVDHKLWLSFWFPFNDTLEGVPQKDKNPKS